MKSEAQTEIDTIDLKTFLLAINVWLCIYLTPTTMCSAKNIEISKTCERYKYQQKFGFNSSPPSAAYMRQWISSLLVQIMTCRLLGPKPLCNPVLGHCQLDSKVQTSMKFNQNIILCIHLIAFDNIVCEMAAILSRAIWVKVVISSKWHL